MAKKHKLHGKHRGAPPRSAPMPGPHEFSAADEQAMRQGNRQANMGPPSGTPMPPPGMGGGEPDADDMGGM